MTWQELKDMCNVCTRCRLCEGRTNVVFGRGNIDADILFVGEGPGRQEDEQGVPFVGQAGQLLQLALTSCGYSDEDYYIANVIKCRPPENRTPFEEECNACMPYLRKQFSFIRPKIVVCLGGVAASNLIDKNSKITGLRGRWIEKGGILFFATYHPAALLRDESKKIVMWQDLKKVKEKFDEIRISQ